MLSTSIGNLQMLDFGNYLAAVVGALLTGVGILY